MRFGFMSRILQYEGYGIKTFLAGLLEGIARLECEHELVVFLDPEQEIPDFLPAHCFTIVRIPPRTGSALGKFWWDHIAVGRACKRLGVDALYAPAHVRPFYSPCPAVVTVHDMMYHLFPDDWSWSERVYFRIATSMLTSRAAALSAVSESTRQDILKFMAVPEERIKVIYHGIPNGFMPVDMPARRALRDKYQLSRPFILYVGSFHPRKNLQGLLDAFEEIAPDFPHDLVIVGLPIWDNPSLRNRIRDSRFAQRIRMIGFVPTSELVVFYNEAEVFVFPSLYEGFGFPVLEAMACGCAAIVSKSSSLPEVAGDAALLVKPDQKSELVTAIHQLLTDGNLRVFMQRKALEQASRFSWVKTAQQTIELLESVARCSNE
ncbi:MAG: glycosyltransferase family 4 protein [Anaerolineales bacterium]|nr:glycosyltransferase family 4 protein [Anaerolineales bacterium]